MWQQITWQQITAIVWAQLRTTRNHLPRTNVGAVLLWLLSLLWYGLFAAMGVLLAVFLPHVSLAAIREWLPAGLLGVFVFWHLIPLFTLSTGWSLQLNKLQIYPVSNSALFGIEVLLRLTTAPEMILLLTGALIGLARHPDIFLSAFFLLLFIPFNLFLSLAIRNVLLHSFERNRFRELFAILLISIGVLPQFLIRTGLGHRMKPYFLAASQGTGTPWREVATLSSGSFSFLALSLILLWILASYAFARWQFEKSLLQDEQFRPDSRPASAGRQARPNPLRNIIDLPARLFSDPMAALIQKEFQSLLRMPRFRVILGMACIFGVIVFVPIALRNAGGPNRFMTTNFLPVVNLYGLLLLSDVLLMNVFGFDRQAAQIYFVTPVPFETVLKAKNLTAIVFIVLQSIAVLILAALIRVSVTPMSIGTACGASAVVGIFFLSIGNLSSIAMPRPVDPRQTFRKQSGGKMQLWLMISSLGMFLLVGFAFLAQWAFESNWALLGVLLVEMVIGVIVYRVATESAVERGLRDRERMMEALSKGVAPVALGV